MSSFRLAAMGDGLIGPLVHSTRDTNGNNRSYIDNRFINWLRVVLPGLRLTDDAVFGVPGETTVAVAARTQAVLDLDPLPDAVLISAGTEDCLATIRGVAPTADQTVGALEALATTFSAIGVTPIFVLPPPCALFSNGLFADRFVTIAATLRRMHEREKRIELMDATDLLMRPKSFGVEPEPRYVPAGADGRLSSLGALRLAQEVARQLRSMVPNSSIRRPPDRGVKALNANPLLTGSGGAITTKDVSGHCATRYRIDTHQLGGAKVRVEKHTDRKCVATQRLTFSGRYTTNWGFVRLSQDLDTKTVTGLAAGDVIEAICGFELGGQVENIAAVSLHTTPVWDNGFIGLHSSLYSGGPGVSEAHHGCLRTPQFVLPAAVRKIHVSLHVHLVPGENLTAGGQLDIRVIHVRKVEEKTMSAAKSNARKIDAPFQARSGV
jgi:hypothetical protein